MNSKMSYYVGVMSFYENFMAFLAELLIVVVYNNLSVR